MKKKSHMWTRVVIHWIDSTQYRQPWWNAKDFMEYTEKRENSNAMMSTGFKFHEDKYFIYFAQSIDFIGDNVSHFGGIFSIPKGCIIKVVKCK